MSTKNESNRPVAVLMLPEMNKPFITFARAVHNALLNNPSFPKPSPTLEEFEKNIDALDEAETKAASRARGAAKLRDAKRQKVEEDFGNLRHYVQSVVDATTNPADGAALIASAFMHVRKAPTRLTSELSAKNGDVSGTVALAARAVAPAATYYWEYSLDQSVWTAAPDTMRSRTEISGLTPASVYYFRFRALTRTGRRDYSQVVSLVVQ